MKKVMVGIVSFIVGAFLTIVVVLTLYTPNIRILTKEHIRANVVAVNLLVLAKIDQDIVDLYITYGTMPIEKREVVSKLLDRKILGLKALQIYMEGDKK